MLQIRADLSSEKYGDEGLTAEGADTMMVLAALLEKYEIGNFKVVRING